MMYPLILVGVDGSKYAEQALEAAIEMARLHGSKLVIATVFSFPQSLGDILNTAPPMPNDAAVQLKDMLEKYRKQAFSSGVKDVEIKILSTFTPLMSVGATIVIEAEKMNASIIVVGTRGMTGIKRTLLGSVADYVVRNAHCDVFVVRRGT
jgi:nucleotide-binding universal stress UspA family protein